MQFDNGLTIPGRYEKLENVMILIYSVMSYCLADFLKRTQYLWESLKFKVGYEISIFIEFDKKYDLLYK